MNSKYDPKVIEPKWQKFWEDNQTFRVETDLKKEKFFGLVEFPYPSGAGLHVGHPRSYTAMDVITRQKRMEGKNVLYPIGFDSFGLPTENFAIKTGRPPAEITDENIANFTRQLKSLGFGFDWSRAVTTSEPEYYKWTQWIFLQLYKHGLAYKTNQPINWCPKDKIGLANEEVVDGCCERCGNPVEKRNKEQWMLAITKYADKLLEGLNEVDYVSRAKTQQENWIGRSEGAEINFPIKDSEQKIKVFTTRPDTIFGVTFLAVSAEWAQKWFEGKEVSAEITNYIAATLQGRTTAVAREEVEKTGIDSGIVAVNPVSNEEVPVWIVNYVLADVGTGAIMAVPAHDERDWEFAQKFGLPIKVVLLGAKHASGLSLDKNGTAHGTIEDLNNSYSDVYTPEEMLEIIEKNGAEPLEDGLICNSDFLNGLETADAKIKMIAHLEEKKIGNRKVQFKLRDWVFSRQRYWGEPIPLVHCDTCADWIPLPESELPLELPKVEKYLPTDTGESPLAAMTDWVKTTCPKCGGPARRETDTMPNWAGSSWYFLRYADPKNDKELASQENLKYWTPVDWYNGGMEHTVLHLLYSRFWNQFLYDIGVVPTLEPYKKRTSHGMILAKGGEKMSKSKGNVVNPDEMVELYGADALRTYIMFMGPFDQPVEWDTNGLVGVRRFLDKVWHLCENVGEHEFERTFVMYKTIGEVSVRIERMSFNTAVSSLMTYANILDNGLGRDANGKTARQAVETLVLLLSPFAPHICEEMWRMLGHTESIAYAKWPQYTEEQTREDEITVAVQVNGKVRAELIVSPDIAEAEIKKLALANEIIQKWLDGKEPQKIIYVPGRLVSIVV